MKLLTKYNRANILTAIIILLVSSASYYIIIRYILLKQIDKDLVVEEQEIHEYVKEKNTLPNATKYKGQQIRFEPATSSGIKRQITTSSVFNPAENDEDPVRVLTFPIEVNGVLHKAVVIKSQVEAEYLVKVIVLVTGCVFLLLLIIITLINRLLLNKLWQPFYHTLQQLKYYDIKQLRPLELTTTNINEFNEMNQSVAEMTKRANNDFEALKAFTDNASHEMQTPLAIINSKLDILLQNSSEKQAEQLQSIYNATARLTRLNHTLLLLTKINNDQYKNQRLINLTLLLHHKFQQFEELIKVRNLRSNYQAEEVSLLINEELVEILLNNLFSNAIRHNYIGGFINCVLTKKKLCITNSGPSLTFHQKNIFDRFQKSDHSDGTGLGLAVAQQICESSSLQITYSSHENEHTF